MADLFRLILAAIALALAGAANAALQPAQSWSVQGGSGTYSSASEACQSAVPPSPGGAAYYTFGSVSGMTCLYDYHRTDGVVIPGGVVRDLSRGPSVCPSNSSADGSGTCACNAPDFVELDGQCRPKNPCPAGQHEEGGACVPDKCGKDEIRVNGVCVKEPPCPLGYTRINGVCKKNGCEPGKDMGDYVTQGESTAYYCDGGCMVKVKPTVCVSWDGKKECTGTGYQTGASCSGGGDGSGDSPGNPDPDGDNGDGDPDGPGGGDPGTGDPGTGDPGTPGGGDPGSGDPGSGDPGSGDPGSGDPGSGDPGTGDPGTPGGGDDDPGTDGVGLPPPKPKDPLPEDDGDDDPDTFNCPDGYHPAPAGRACIKDPTEPDGDGKCPEGTVRINGMCHGTYTPGTPGGDGDGDGDGDDKSAWAGECMSGFGCEGDAIFCAIAKEQHRRACKLFDDKSVESELYEKEKGKTGEQTKDLPGNREESLMNRISTADAFGSGQCIQDLTVFVVGKSVTLPMSKICPTLQIIGNIMVGVALLLAIRIVGRG